MDRLFYKPENAWVGDLIPYYESGTFYAFYLHDPRKRQEEYAEETTWHLVTTTDFKSVEYHGEAIKRGGDDQPDKNAYTGSVVKSGEEYYAFFTAYNEEYKNNGKAIQSVMCAKGKDLYHLKTDNKFRFLSDNIIYEPFDWRDPYVFFNEEDNCWWMLLASRVKGAGELRGGCIALCKSHDLIHWSYCTPFYSPNMYVTMECPEVFKMGNYWYLVFSTFSDRFVTHYRISSHIDGPWKIPEIDTFDCRADYAIKTASDGKRRFTFGWIASKKGSTDFGAWEWGGSMVFHELIQDHKTGLIHVKAIESVANYYPMINQKNKLETWNGSFKQASGEFQTDTLGAVLTNVPRDCFSFRVCFKVSEAIEFGIALHTDNKLEKGYFLRMNPATSSMALDMWPRTDFGKYQWQIDGDMPFQIETMRPLPNGPEYQVQIIREQDICVIYVNDEVVLSTRTYNYKSGMAGVYLVQGKAEIHTLECSESGTADRLQ
jgi:beta-fructofuranosidase